MTVLLSQGTLVSAAGTTFPPALDVKSFAITPAGIPRAAASVRAAASCVASAGISPDAEALPAEESMAEAT